MNRTDRLLAIVLELQAHGRRRAEDLAATFEVSKRTLYRDIQALCEAGVPIVAEPGRGYSLEPGYFLPPLRFHADEALMLLLGADVMAQSFDAEYQRAAQDAARKIAGALPESRRLEVDQLRESLRFLESTTVAAHDDDLLRLLRRAIIQERTICFAYQARFSNDGSGVVANRRVDPYGLLRANGSWYLTGFCHLRQNMRSFRLHRISQCQLTEASFQRVPGKLFRPLNEPRPLQVSLRFTARVAPWVREAPNFFTTESEDQADGGLLVTLHVRQLEEILAWVLSWGSQVDVLEPDMLRLMIAAEASAMLAQLSESQKLLT